MRPADVASATLALAGFAAIAFPAYVVSVVQVSFVVVAVSVALHALAAHVPQTGWLEPFKWMSPLERASRAARRGRGRSDVHGIRAKLSGARRRIPDASPLPPELVRSLQTLVARALDVDGDPCGDRVARFDGLRDRVSADLWAILVADPSSGGWLRTLPPDRRAVSASVHRALDELERLLAGDDVATADPILPPSPPSLP